jgi:hypothetical protein
LRRRAKRTLKSARGSAKSSLTAMMLETDAGMAVDRVGPTALIAQTAAGIADTVDGIAGPDAGFVQTADGIVKTWPGTNDGLANSASRAITLPHKKLGTSNTMRASKLEVSDELNGAICSQEQLRLAKERR